MSKNVSTKLVGVLVDEVTEDDMGFMEIQDDDIIVGEFPEEAKELFIIRLKIRDDLMKIMNGCKGNDENGINFRKKQCRRCVALQVAIHDLDEEIHEFLKEKIYEIGFSGVLEIKKGWKLVLVMAQPLENLSFISFLEALSKVQQGHDD